MICSSKSEDERITITYLGGCWPTNIGNSFLDLGSIQSLKMASPNSIIHFVSELPKWLGWRFGMQNRIIDLIRVTKMDYLVFSGMALCIDFINLRGPTLLKLKEKKVKILINGGGGGNYSHKEIGKVTKFMKKITPYAFISRDEQSFENYKNLAENSFNGIDCGFFINDYFAPAQLALPEYVILNFDSIPEPKLCVNDKLVIRLHHSCCGIPKMLLGASLKGRLVGVSLLKDTLLLKRFDKPNTLISDLPYDYLNLYANTEETHSDRVHACVATLSFGHPCKLYTKSPRASLLDRIGATTIKDKLTHPDTDKIEKEKKKQIKFLSEILVV